MKLTHKQEKFCQAIMKGKNQSDAYREAYNTSKMKDASVNVNASKLLKDTKITLRVEELRKECEKEFKYEVEQHFKELTEIQEKALKKGQFASALRAEELKGKLFGFYEENYNLKLKGDKREPVIVKFIK